MDDFIDDSHFDELESRLDELSSRVDKLSASAASIARSSVSAGYCVGAALSTLLSWRRITRSDGQIISTPDKFECIGRRRSAWCRKAELSGR
jgi:hypothetical protein